MDYHFAQDLRSIREILGMTQAEFAAQIGVEQVTVSRNERGKTNASEALMERVYAYAYRNRVQLNRLKEMLWTESLGKQCKMLFHGSKNGIEGDLSIRAGRANNDFGQGFYTGERYEQAISFVSGFDRASVYLLGFDGSGLRRQLYEVDQEWMLTIAYYRGTLTEYRDHPVIEKLRKVSRDCDYIVAPIADNRMYRIIHSFIDGEITDEQCRHCLAATNLGMQYIFVSDSALRQVKLLERCYVSEPEKEFYKKIRSADAKLGDDKVKLARIRYRGRGRYIDEILA